MLSNFYLKQIAWRLQQSGVGAFAFCVDERFPAQVYYVADTGFQANTPDSCLVRLLQGIPFTRVWTGDPKLYFCKSGALNAMERGMLEFVYPGSSVRDGVLCTSVPTSFLQQVILTPGATFNTATQISFGNVAFEHHADYDLNDANHDIVPKLRKVHRIYMMAAYALLAAPAIAKSYNVAALLVGPDGRILSYGVNRSYVNFSCHAEVNALQGCLRNGRAIPAQSTLYTTLQPCRMCAGMIDVSMHQGRVIYSVKDTHYNGPADHMYYVSQTPMYELSTVAKPLKTWTTGRVYDKVYGQTKHANLGTAQNADHRSIEIETTVFKRRSIIQYLNNEGIGFNVLGSNALTRKKEKYHFRRVELLNKLNLYVDEALLEVTSFLTALKIPLKTVQEERVEQAVANLRNYYQDQSQDLWNHVTARLLTVVENGEDLDYAIQEIANTLSESDMELEYEASLPTYRGAPFYS